ncbi:carboxymuconolactone decarboxylase family protein [Pectinatus frisingensis]|uniref:carboxymuconolactone decarboxylase family protein n=1 Tax=Pectinatus frisingensis TaxID=865 RepID=UPI0018C4878C|nr:carboxymuconolactone decarboxylase family protein [Pectinatus frisingensis]
MEDRLKRGLKKLQEVDGKVGDDVANNMNDIFPDFVKYMIEYVWGDIYTRNILNLKSKEMAVVAALTAMGNVKPQLKVHINGALNVGCTINEIKEIILQISAYAGFPASINAIDELKNVLKERENQGIKDCIGEKPTNRVLPTERYDAGLKELSQLDSHQAELLNETYKDISPDLVKFIICGQADIMARDNLSKRLRELSTISALTALGTAAPQLNFHINAGINVGATVDEIKEIMLLISVYSGFPKAINGINTLKEVLAKRRDNGEVKIE